MLFLKLVYQLRVALHNDVYQFQLLVSRNTVQNSISAKLMRTNEHQFSSHSVCNSVASAIANIFRHDGFMHATWNEIPCKTLLKITPCCVFADGIINLHWKRVINFFGKNDVIDVVGNSFKQTNKKHTTLNSFCFTGTEYCVATNFW